MRILPTSIQFELTYACNSHCSFCYNGFAGLEFPEASTDSAKRILHSIADAGVFGVNFNGGEPLLRQDFFDLVEHATRLGLDTHLNTNCTTIGRTEARHLARNFRAICTTVLAADAASHDALTGRRGSFAEAQHGIRALIEEDVYVAANVTLCKANVAGLKNILTYLHSLGVSTVLITRVIVPSGSTLGLSLTDADLERALRVALAFQRQRRSFERLAFPQPYPPCRFPSDIRAELKRYNVPCTIGLNTARVAPNGDVTPCALVPGPCLGNLVQTPFRRIWQEFDGTTYFHRRLPLPACRGCPDLDRCGGGCLARACNTQRQQ